MTDKKVKVNGLFLLRVITYFTIDTILPAEVNSVSTPPQLLYIVRSMKSLIGFLTFSILIAFKAYSAAQCSVIFNSSASAQLTEAQIVNLVDKSKSYQDKRNKAWAERNKCLCCHTSLPYMLSRGLDPESKTNFDTFRDLAVSSVENPQQRPWYHADDAGRNSKPTEAVLNALTLLMYDVSNQSSLKPTTLKAVDLIFEHMESDGRIHWLDFHLQPFESKNGELWGNSMALLVIEMAKKHSDYVPKPAQYGKLKAYVLGHLDQLKLHEMSVLLWANSQGGNPKVLTAELKELFISKIFSAQNTSGSWNQKAVLGQGQNEESVYATSIALIGLIKAGQINNPLIHRAAKWLGDQQQTGNFLNMGDGSVLWVATSMNRTDSVRNDRFASDFTTSYASLALQFYKSALLALH